MYLAMGYYSELPKEFSCQSGKDLLYSNSLVDCNQHPVVLLVFLSLSAISVYDFPYVDKKNYLASQFSSLDTKPETYSSEG